jgi:hypothetical protein
MRRYQSVLVFTGLIVAIGATRIPVAPEHLFYHDSANLAFAIENFNPLLHQPQPPGYPVFVGLMRLLRLVLPSAESVLLAAGILGLAAASWFLYRFATEAFSARAGWFAATLLAFHPIGWYGGLTNPVRIYFAVAITGAAWLGWRAWRSGRPRDYLWTAVYVGVASGFRPSTALLLLPLLLVLGLRQKEWRVRWGGWALYASGVVSWTSALFWVSGGIRPYFEFLAGYSQSQFGSSLFYGAAPGSALDMIGTAFVWTFFGALVWVAAVPFARRRHPEEKPAPSPWPYLALCYLPAFVFLALVHVADPDQTLAVVPGACILGAVALSRATVRWGRPQTAGLLVLLALGSSYLFRHPPKGKARAAGYGVVRYQRDHMRTAMRELRQVLDDGDADIISFRPAVSWRNLSYYFRNESILVVDPDDPTRVWNTNPNGSVNYNGEVVVLSPERQSVLLLPPPGSGIRAKLVESAPFQEHGSLLRARLPEGTEFDLGGVHFRVARH